MSLIEISNLGKTYNLGSKKAGLEVLKDITLSIDEGEFVIFLGPSGCGKSTLLRIVAGLETPSSGIVRVEGEEISKPSRERGMVFQSYTSFPWLTVFRNIEFGLKHSGMEKEIRYAKTQRYIDMVGLHGFEDSYPHELSGGMKQRLAIARSLVMDPKILHMDEPFGALDAQVRQSLQEEIISIQRDTGKTILFVTHDIDEALLLGSRIIVLSSLPGSIVHDEKRIEKRRLSREYFFTDDFVTDKRRFARLIEGRSLRIGLSEWAGNAPILYAKEKEFIPPSIDLSIGLSSHQRVSGFKEGRYDVIGIEMSSLIGQIPTLSGKFVLASVGSCGIGTDVLVVRKEKVLNIEDLGKARIGFAPKSRGHLQFACIFDEHNLDFSNLTLNCERNVSIIGNQHIYIEHLRAGEIDAAILTEPAITELFSSENKQYFSILDTGIDQGLFNQVYIAREDIIHRKRDLLLSYLRFVLESNALLIQNEQDTLSLLHRRFSRSGSQESSFIKKIDSPYYLFENLLYYDIEDNIRYFSDGELLNKLFLLSEIAFKAEILDELITKEEIQNCIDDSFIRNILEESEN